jgi:mannitol/fructose-specific phosphotransferase system IIA component (Ntr-type)
MTDPANGPISLTDLLAPERIVLPLVASDREQAIGRLMDRLVEIGDVADRADALDAVHQRERTRSTGVATGLALPHGKSHAVQQLTMAMGVSPEPIDFGSASARLVILLMSPIDRTGPHIRALARISRLLDSEALREELIASGSPEQLYDRLCRCEKAPV